MTRVFAAAIVSFILSGTAQAAEPAGEHPPFLPTKDAVLGYHLLPAAGEAIDARVTFRANTPGLRMDLPDQTYVLVMPENNEVLLVAPLYRSMAELPWAAGPQGLFMLDERMKYTKKGEATVAGVKCTQWEGVFEKIRNQMCVSQEGLVLRNQLADPQGRRNMVEAFIVKFQPANEADFVVPKDFDRLTPEQETPKPGPKAAQ